MSALATGVTMPTAMSLASRAEALVPQSGGHLRLAIPKGRDFDALVAFATSNTLMELAPDGKVVPEIARSAGTDDGGRSWVFDLRDDVTFHDGTRLRAKHVLESLNRSDIRRHELVVGIEVTALNQIRFQLTRAEMDFPRLLTDPSFVVRKQADDGTWIGTGGYRRVPSPVNQPGLHLRKSADYWKEGRAHVDSVVLIQTDGPASLHTDIIGGAVDYAAAISPETVAFLAHLPEIEMLKFEATRALVLRAAGSGDHAASAAVISRLKGNLDRQSVVEQALLGHGVIGNDTFLRTTQTGYDSFGTKASGALSALVLNGDQTSWVRPAARAFNEAGIKLAWRGQSNTNAVLDAISCQASDVEAWVYAPETCVSLFGSKTAEATEFVGELTRARAIEASGERAAATSAAASLLAENGAFLLPAWAHDISAFSNRLKHGAQISHGRPNDGHRLIERWWLTT